MTAAAIIAEADSISASASKIRSLISDVQRELDAITPPVVTPPVVLKGIDPDDMPGVGDRAKTLAACQEAIARNRPVILSRMYVRECLELDERYNGLTIIGMGERTGFVMPDIPDVTQIAWGWQIHLNPKEGKRLRVRLVNFAVNGNRAKVAPNYNPTQNPAHTQHGIVVGGYYDSGNWGQVELEASDIWTHGHDYSGFMSTSPKNRSFVRRLRTFDNGMSGVDLTRGVTVIEDSDAWGNAGLQFNASNAEYTRLTNVTARNGGGTPYVGGEVNGGGIKISAAPWGESKPAHLHLENVRIEDCRGGLTATSAPPGSVISGTRLECRRNSGAAINLTDQQVTLNVDSILCEDGLQGAAVDADVLIFGGPQVICNDLTIRRSAKRGLVGGYGSNITANTVEVTDCAGTGIDWQQGKIDAQITNERNG